MQNTGSWSMEKRPSFLSNRHPPIFTEHRYIEIITYMDLSALAGLECNPGEPALRPNSR
jgi:hypothetical protein